jgi:ParB family transcriptional regulator, chromosome partitioning protein
MIFDMITQQVDVSVIDVGHRLRAPDPDWIAAIADSFAEHGQQTPIEVRITGERYELVSGLHRLEGARRLGWTSIAASVLDISADEAELRQIDENLMRRELCELDRAVFLAQRQQVWQRLHPHTAQPGRKSGQIVSISADGAPAPRFSKATAEKLGMSPRSIDRAIARAKIADDVRRALVGHPVADRAGQLDLLAALPPRDQRRVLGLLQADKPARSVADACVALGLAKRPQAPAVDQMARCRNLFLKLTAEQRQAFVAWAQDAA